jgi:hypothetical protein
MIILVTLAIFVMNSEMVVAMALAIAEGMWERTDRIKQPVQVHHVVVYADKVFDDVADGALLALSVILLNDILEIGRVPCEQLPQMLDAVPVPPRSSRRNKLIIERIPVHP